MRDEHGKLTIYEKPDIILKGKVVSAMSENPVGHLYFSLYELDRKIRSK